MTTSTTTDQLIGRARELERVAAAVAAGRPVLIIGEPGIGKTALARAGARAAAPPRIWEGGGIATLDWMGYLPFRRALGLRLPDGDASVVADFIADQAEDGLFIVDDLQWVDRDTVTATLLLADRVPVVAITRPLPRGDDIRTRLAEAGWAVLELAPLDEHDAAHLATAHNPRLARADARSVARRAGGNPLLVQGLAHARGDTTELALALRARLADLSAEARAALHRIAVLERPASLDLAPDDIRQLIDMGLVTRSEEGVQVRHALIADAVLDTVSPAHLRELHRAVAQRVDDPGEAARHWAAAGERGKARALALEAAATAERPTERARCAALAATCLDGPERDRELVAAMSRLAALSDFPAVVDLSHQITPGSRDEPEALRLRARGLFETHQPDQAAAAVAAGLATADRFGDKAASVRLRITAAYHMLWSGDPATLRPGELIADARALGVADAEMHVQAASAIATTTTVGPLAIELANRGRELALEEDHAWAEQESWAAAATALNNLGRWEEAREATRLGETELLRRGYHTSVARVRATHADQMAWDCEYDAALALTEELLARPSLLGGSWDMAVWSRALALSDRGEYAAADGLLDSMEGRVLPGGAHWVALTRAEALLARGESWAAARIASAALERVHIDVMRPQALALVARANWECDVPVAQDHQRMDVGAAFEHYAEIDGLIALQAGESSKAAEHFRYGLTHSGWRRHAIRYRLGLAEALDLFDPEQSTFEFEALVSELRQVGWTSLLARVEPLVDAPPGHRRLRAIPARLPSSITRREHDILALVADGLTSRTIAERLKLSQTTVESHIRSAMRKLDARTRTEAAAMIRVT